MSNNRIAQTITDSVTAITVKEGLVVIDRTSAGAPIPVPAPIDGKDDGKVLEVIGKNTFPWQLLSPFVDPDPRLNIFWMPGLGGNSQLDSLDDTTVNLGANVRLIAMKGLWIVQNCVTVNGVQNGVTPD